MTAVMALRALHFAAAVALFGEFAFALLVAPPDAAARRRLLRVAGWSLALLAVSGALWLGAQARSMSGVPLAADVLRAVVGETLFGRVSVLRLALAAALAAAIFLLRREVRGATLVCASISGALVASIAWTGHAAAEEGADRVVHLSADALHLLAAGAWIGALWPLASALGREGDAARAARRFSALGIVCVATLVVTGVANAVYTVGSVPAMIGTAYGRLLSAKLALFAAMLALAAVNRWRLTPRLAGAEAAPLARLRRNAAIEAALGLAVLGVVGALGATVPALHVQTVWPFPVTLDLEAARGAEALLGALLVVPLVALGLIVAGSRGGRVLTGAGVVLLIGTLASGLRLLAVPAHPTTYFQSPVRYAADSIARGADLYRGHCAACHGARAHGDGPAAASLAVRPPDLAAHSSHHREGDFFWWIERGIPGTPMPGFADTVPESAAWDVINFVRAQADAADADALDASVRPGTGIAAPDFAFQVGTQPQESLADVRGRSMVLLVLYELPASRARLRALAGIGIHWQHLGVRVIAFPVRGRAAKPDEGDPGMLADADARVAAAYALLSPGGVARPVEFLIDRQGDIRARWAPGTPGWDAMPALLGQIEALDREPPRPLARRRHVH